MDLTAVTNLFVEAIKVYERNTLCNVIQDGIPNDSCSNSVNGVTSSGAFPKEDVMVLLSIMSLASAEPTISSLLDAN